MAEGISNFRQRQNVTFDRTFEFYDESDPPELIDLTGYTATLKLRRTHSTASTPVLTLTESAGLTLGGVLGTIRWVITSAEMLSIPVGPYYYVLRGVSGSSNGIDLLAGKFEVIFDDSQ